MPREHTAPYGSWSSPVTSELIVSDSVRLTEIRLENGDTYWLEGRPAENGRTVVVRQTQAGSPVDVTPPPYNVRTRVHEYGGGAYSVAGNTIYFSNFEDNRLYRQALGSQPEPLTVDDPALRYADLIVDHQRSRLICVRQDHTQSDQQAVNTIVAVDLASGQQTILVEGADFYASPRLAPDGHYLAWLSWNHPNLPWNGTELHLGKVEGDGSISETRSFAGGAEESVLQPEWSPTENLYFVSDRNGWWNLYRYEDGTTREVLPMEAEFAGPMWVFGLSTYDFAAHRIVAAYSQNGQDQLVVVDTENGAVSHPDLPYNSYSYVHASDHRAVFLAASPTELPAIVQFDLENGATEVLRRSGEARIPSDYISRPEPIEFPTENGQTAHALYYAPCNPQYRAPPGAKPPLIVHVHGGPTGSASPRLDLNVQFWTSRGFAYLDVNYGGSTGYGRAYRERLHGQWGIVDVQDAINGARYLIDQGLADPERVVITGGSAGGYTTLRALTMTDFFAVGSSHFGISDLGPFARDTHKFEARYLDKLIAPYPEGEAIYVERSPVTHADRLSAPTIIFQGLDDKIVPPSQAEFIVDVLERKGIPYAYVPFEGEGHGFRRAGNIKRALDSELAFFSAIFGFELPEPVEGAPIENLGERQSV